jgi:predicted nucleotide-binding protein (sugar kinase/HSP70/actin superfamily)
LKISFPYMGPVLAYQKLFERLGHTVIPPSPPTADTLALGAKYSPEFICLPFKIILGSFLEAARQGAELMVTSGGIGACRAVYYGRLSEKILQQLGYKVKVMVFNSLFEDFNGFTAQCRELKNGRTANEFIRVLHLAIRLVYASDSLEKQINRIRPYETVPGTCSRVWREIRSLLEECPNWSDLGLQIDRARRLIAAIPLDRGKKTLKVGLVGEIYLVMENAANYELESKLATYDVEVIRSWYLSDWITHCLLPPKRMLREAGHYLGREIGGHERDSIGHILEYQKMGCDGVIHLLPFGCMPELVTQTIIPRLTADFNLPILSLSLDEQTGWMNYQIRLEAFIELLWNRKELLQGVSHG